MRTLVYIPLEDSTLAGWREWARAASANVHVLGIGDDEAELRLAAETFSPEGARNGTFLLAPSIGGRGTGLKWAARYAIDHGFRALAVPRLGENPEAVLARASALIRSGGAVAWLAGCPGLSAVATGFLKSVPFDLNDDGESFDMDLRLQAENVGAGVLEEAGEGSLPWIYRLSRLKFRLHRSGVFCSLKFSRGDNLKYLDKTALSGSTHAVALDLVRRLSPKRLLDVGSGQGHFARRCAELGVEVVAVDRETPKDPGAFRALAHDLEKLPFPFEAEEYDVITALDVVEHLSRPEAFLLALRNGKTVLVSTPNVAFFAVRLCLLLGRFNYAERGILDVDHKRLFTKSSLQGMLGSCGYEIERCLPIGVPGTLAIPGPVGWGIGLVSGWAARLWPSLFAFQFLFVCKARATARQLRQVEPSKRRKAGKGA